MNFTSQNHHSELHWASFFQLKWLKIASKTTLLHFLKYNLTILFKIKEKSWTLASQHPNFHLKCLSWEVLKWVQTTNFITFPSLNFHKIDCLHNSDPLLSLSISSVKATMEFSNKVQQNLHYNYLNKQRVAADSLHQSIFHLSRLPSQ